MKANLAYQSNGATSVSMRADQLRREISPTLDSKRRATFGQFMTPEPIAAVMAAMFGELPEEVRLLDAGAGMGSLTAAFVTEALSRKTRPRSISVTAFEIDTSLAKLLEKTLTDCRDACVSAGVIFSSQIIGEDYILRSADAAFTTAKGFNCAILNPPYAKINSASPWRLALRSQGIETVNLYSAFVALALNQLEPKGELVAITPRSFCNGPYYKPFREHVLSCSSVERLYIFGSRRKAFQDDAVLQENLIFHLRRDEPQAPMVHLETDEGDARKVAFEDVVRPGDKDRFILLTLTGADASIARRVQALPCSLADLGINVSTGRIVDFRRRLELRKDASADTAPLIYPSHLRDGGVRWPIPNFKKSNAIAISPRVQRDLIPPGCYLLAKRFSSKEEKRRLVVSVYDTEVPAAIENKLNFFHCNGAGLPTILASGLSTYLNSTAVDDYFRLFSGHTQVNATDLRNLHFPSLSNLEMLGRTAPVGQKAIDEAVEAIL